MSHRPFAALPIALGTLLAILPRALDAQAPDTEAVRLTGHIAALASRCRA